MSPKQIQKLNQDLSRIMQVIKQVLTLVLMVGRVGAGRFRV
jgi:hypothetical protein